MSELADKILALSGEQPTPQGFRLLSVEDLRKLPKPTWLIDSYIPKSGLVVLYGPSGSGKSFVVLGWALSIATGHTWLTHPVQVGPVVYVAAEGSGGLSQRVEAWLRVSNVEEVDNLFFLTEPVQLMDPVETNRLIGQLQTLATPPSMVIVDTLARCLVGGDENSARDTGLFIRGADRIREETGATVVIVHHTNKGGAVERGSGALRAAADAMISLTPEDDVIRFEVDKMKDAAPGEPLLLRLVPTGDSCTVGMATVAPKRADLTPKQKIALRTLAALGGSGWSSWKDSAGLSDMTLTRASKRLLDLGYIEVDASKRYKTYCCTDSGTQMAAIN